MDKDTLPRAKCTSATQDMVFCTFRPTTFVSTSHLSIHAILPLEVSCPECNLLHGIPVSYLRSSVLSKQLRFNLLAYVLNCN